MILYNLFAMNKKKNNPSRIHQNRIKETEMHNYQMIDPSQPDSATWGSKRSEGGIC